MKYIDIFKLTDDNGYVRLDKNILEEFKYTDANNSDKEIAEVGLDIRSYESPTIFVKYSDLTTVMVPLCNLVDFLHKKFKSRNRHYVYKNTFTRKGKGTVGIGFGCKDEYYTYSIISNNPDLAFLFAIQWYTNKIRKVRKEDKAE